MSCPHAVWERNSAVEADGLCPLCLKSMLELAEQRLKSSERIRTALVQKLNATPTPEAILLQARKSDGDEWTDIFPAQLSWMAKEGFEVRALEGTA